MEWETRDLRRGDCLTPTDMELLWNPLEFQLEDHMREREICRILDRIAAPERHAQKVSRMANADRGLQRRDDETEIAETVATTLEPSVLEGSEEFFSAIRLARDDGRWKGATVLSFDPTTHEMSTYFQ